MGQVQNILLYDNKDDLIHEVYVAFVVLRYKYMYPTVTTENYWNPCPPKFCWLVGCFED